MCTCMTQSRISTTPYNSKARLIYIQYINEPRKRLTTMLPLTAGPLSLMRYLSSWPQIVSCLGPKQCARTGVPAWVHQGHKHTQLLEHVSRLEEEQQHHQYHSISTLSDHHKSLLLLPSLFVGTGVNHTSSILISKSWPSISFYSIYLHADTENRMRPSPHCGQLGSKLCWIGNRSGQGLACKASAWTETAFLPVTCWVCYADQAWQNDPSI